MRLTIPNQLTILRILLTPVFLILIFQDSPPHQLLASFVFTIAALTDWYDGWYARKFGVISRAGQFMDPLADKVLVISALITFALLGVVHSWMVWVIIIRDTLITINRIFALYIGKPIITHVIAKWKTALQMITIFIILIYINLKNYLFPNTDFSPTDLFNPINILMLTVTLLTIISGLIYIRENRELLLFMFRRFFRL